MPWGRLRSSESESFAWESPFTADAPAAVPKAADAEPRKSRSQNGCGPVVSHDDRESES
jgi:hypothetical protein